jgi:hypothetical protein
MIYMDTSALTKLLIAEPQTPELRTWLTAQIDAGDSAATSSLGRVELMRTVARYGDTGQVDRARYLLDGLDILPLTLRSLDAIHLAAAAYFEKELTAFVTYDHRLLNGCRDIGLTTASPGGAR